MSNINIKSDMGGNPLNIIRNMSYKIYNDVIITGTLNGTISNSSFNWNINGYYTPLQNNINNTCLVLGSGGGQYYLDKNDISYAGIPYGTRLIIEYKE